jgi:1-acyl-sn-glycerol-3-phosphate acyltransferase
MVPEAPPAPYEQNRIPRLMWKINAAYARFYQHVEILAPCRIPPRGPAILVCNHISSLDPILIQSACRRVIRWMVAREYYQQRGVKWILDQVGAIPVDRTGRDLAATRAALAALEAGSVLGVFPEGKIETDCDILPFQSGIILLAAKSGAPIHPACLEGTQRGKEMLAAYFSRSRAKLAFGPPLLLDRSAAGRTLLEASNEQVRNSVINLRQTYMIDRKCQ